MTRGNIFWGLMILWFIFGLFGYFGTGTYAKWSLTGNDLLTFVLLGLLGWKVFGPAIKGD